MHAFGPAEIAIKREKERRKKVKVSFTQEDLNSIQETIKQKHLTLEEKLGQGGFASVYKVTSSIYKTSFALKIFKDNPDEPNKAFKSFQCEKDALVHLDHPNIIKLYDSFRDDKFYYLLLEYCSSGSLKSIEEPLSVPQFKCIGSSMLKAIEYCHSQGYAHCDIKPNNFLIDKTQRIKLSDFGLAQPIRPNELSKMIGGSKPYMAPEVVLKQPYDPSKADIWSLGISFFFLGTKKLPWHSQDLVQLNQEIVSGLIQFPSTLNLEISKLIYSMINRLPSCRPTASQLLDNSFFISVPTLKIIQNKSNITEGKSGPIFSPRVNLAKLPLLSVEGLRRQRGTVINRGRPQPTLPFTSRY
ncbi:CAMK family protein kinase [Tritrichomonas foetus]|uniref:CAMK family protein kinase n=1 Tax=Tritrichomonas foetus TaxID=1144522 RepID=A0A1J4KS33_9EUKA|nr:CAMK family protein kinase [Tritrichomonas foetus]|eukprot:OHT14087.1 CAMK family protein kinase [Tritrichomonas foetus]